MARTVNLGTRPMQSNTGAAGGTGGTLGGLKSAVGNPTGQGFSPVYLWGLVLAEVFALGILRQHFTKRHGG